MASRASRITFFVIFAITGFLFYRTLRPIFLWVGIGAFCAVLSYGPYVRLTHRLRGRRRLAAAICTAAVMLTIVAPLIATGWAVVNEGLAIAERLSKEPELTRTDSEGIPGFVPAWARSYILRVQELVPVSREQVRAAAASAAQSAVSAASGFLAGVTNVGVGIFLWILSLYYFYVDGPHWLRSVRDLLPLPARHSDAFFREFRSVSHAVFFGNIVTAIAQGVLGGIAFLIVGIPGAVLYGSLIALAGVLPLVGAVLVWLPASIWLLANGRIVAGVFMIAWGALVVGSIDNLLRPVLTKGQLQMHPLLVFLSIFGGLGAFGFPGIFLGPLFAALFLAAVRIYSLEFPPKGTRPPADELPGAQPTDTAPDGASPAPVH